ncbi:MAG: thiamine pyrophosphate-dependent dehydrogenase E1 component subunit alpha [Atribacterota bacterium]|nr:thiamine pyrophosphate-dependent dehydrogenase E1 component subunit alpha [Atribacterota bacterium]
MLKIRYFEQKVEELSLGAEIPGHVHLYTGEEAIATGVCANLTNKDYILSTHRGHGHCIAKGALVKKMMAEIYGKKTGYCEGKGGSMHIADFSIGMLGANGIVGGGLTLAVGAALAIKMQKREQVVAVFFGDGASNRGTFHEAINMAAIWNLPVIFVCENNMWGDTTSVKYSTSVKNIATRAIGYNIYGVIVDGNDVFEVYNVAKEAINRAKKGEGPTIIEAKTYRIKGHFVGDPEEYRSREEVRNIFEKDDPIKNFEKKALSKSFITYKKMDQIKQRVKEIIIEAVDFARNSPFPEPKDLFDNVYTEEVN